MQNVGTRSFSPNETYLKAKTLPADDPAIAHHWYGMYVRYQHEMRVKEMLDELGFTTFIPMKSIPEVHRAEDSRRAVTDIKRVPALHNFIFIYSFYARIRWVKMFNSIGSEMQFLRYTGNSISAEDRFIPTAQMERFIEASKRAENDYRAKYITPENARRHINKNVRFVRGNYEGLEGMLQRIDKNRMVVLDLKGVVSLALPIEHITDIEITDKQ